MNGIEETSVALFGVIELGYSNRILCPLSPCGAHLVCVSVSKSSAVLLCLLLVFFPGLSIMFCCYPTLSPSRFSFGLKTILKIGSIIIAVIEESFFFFWLIPTLELPQQFINLQALHNGLPMVLRQMSFLMQPSPGIE